MRQALTSNAPGGWGRSFRSRDAAAQELMDDPHCDAEKLRRTYQQFAVINRVVAGWRRTYARRIRPRFTGQQHTLLDVGTGGGDIARALAGWAKCDGVSLAVTAIDPNAAAIGFAAGQASAPSIEWLSCLSSDLVREGRQFDFVVSNHVLHHLTGEELGALLIDSERLATGLALHSDIRRSSVGYGLFSALTLPLVLAPPGRTSFIRPDGLTSVRRSFTEGELSGAIPSGWIVQRQAPYRILLTRG